MVLLGYIAFLDPPQGIRCRRPSPNCGYMNIRSKVLTGDNEMR